MWQQRDIQSTAFEQLRKLLRKEQQHLQPSIEKKTNRKIGTNFKCHMRTSVQRFTRDYLYVKPDLARYLSSFFVTQMIFNCRTTLLTFKLVSKWDGFESRKKAKFSFNYK